MMLGSLQIAVIMNPVDDDSWNTNKGDHHTDLEINGQEWEALVFDVLQAPKFQEYVEGEDSNIYFERQEELLKENLTGKGFPMLGNLWCKFIWCNSGRDVSYLPSDVPQLLAECLKLQRETENICALSALEKLIAACYEATKINSGLCLF